MCTVVCDWDPSGRPVRILALRDELTTREFDLPGRWWPELPTVVGGRDAVAGGSWCVSDVRTGVTALVLNRVERRAGTPSRGGLPLAAMRAGTSWPESVEHIMMASFTLVLAAPDLLTAWTWDARELRRVDLEPGIHMVTSAGIAAADPKTVVFAPILRTEDWRSVVAANPPSDRPGALVVRHPVGRKGEAGEAGEADDGGDADDADDADDGVDGVDSGVWATVFGQLITASAGRLEVEYSRTPWLDPSWSHHEWTQQECTQPN